MSKVFNLTNNIEVFYKRNENTPRIALCFNFSINEKERTDGVYALMARLFMQGTKTRTSEQLANELDEYAIEFSVELKQDYIRFRFVCLNEDFSKAIELMTDIIKNSTFEEFDKELEKMKGEIIAELDSPRAKVSDAYYRNMFKDHPYGSTYTKILENVDKITKEDVLEAYKKFMSNSRKVIAVVGELSESDVKTKLEKAFGDIVNDKNETSLLPVRPLEKEEVAEIIKPDAPRIMFRSKSGA